MTLTNKEKKKMTEYINRNGKPWFKQRPTKKLMRTVAILMFGETKEKKNARSD